MHTLTRPFGSVLVLALTVVLGALGGTASAAVAGLELFSGPSVTDSSNKSVSNVCSGVGKQVLGAAGEITGGGGQVSMDAIRPNAALNIVDVQGVEDENGFAGNWTVTGHLICANSVPGLERRASTSVSDSLNKARTANCPTSKRVVGGGAEIGGGAGQVVIEDIRPNATLKSVTANGVEDETGFDGNWTVTTYAICANPIAGLQLVTATSPSNSTNKSVTATCPVGKNLVGVGAERTGGAGQVVIDAIVPNAQLTSVTVGAAEDETGFASGWSVKAHAICANATQRFVSTLAPSSNNKGTGWLCGVKKAVGIGGDITGGNGQVVMEDINTNFPLEIGSVQAFEDDTGFAGNWGLRAYVVCTTALPGLEFVSAASAVNSNPFRSVTASCTPGKQLVGMGAATDPSGGGQVIVEDMIPSSTLSSATVQAFEDITGFIGNWGLAAQAICADPVPGLELVSVDSEFDSDPHSVTATCSPGKTLLGVAGNVNTNGFGQVVIDDLRPAANLKSVLVTGVEIEGGSGLLWSLTAHAICANP